MHSTTRPAETLDFLGRYIGTFHAAWLGAAVSNYTTNQRDETIRKLNATPGIIPVDVYRLDLSNGPRYTCRVPGHCGFFSLDQFLWFRSPEGSDPSKEKAKALSTFYTS